MIDVTMTATHRPELLKRTLESFFENLFYNHRKELRLVINIDPVGSEKSLVPEIKNIISSYFDTSMVNTPSKAGFPRAFRTVWTLATAPLVFNLEEDWVLEKRLNFSDMLSLMSCNPTLAHLRLNAFHSTPEHVKCWNHFLPWNGEFYECKPDDKGTVGWCGHPSLNRSAFVKGALSRMNPEKNPEKQIKRSTMGDYLDRWRFGVYAPRLSDPCIRDIGREWMKQNGWRKMGNPQFFTNWEKCSPCVKAH